MSCARCLAALALVVASAAGCGTGGEPGGSSRAGGDSRPLTVVTSFYPLQWAAQQVAGSHAEVTSLTKPGAEPHDLELGPRHVGAVADADLIVYLKTFQPAVDDAVAQQGPDRSFDVAEVADLDLTFTPIADGAEHADEAGTTDPHFWLDPLRLAAVGDALAERLNALDGAHAAEYRENAAALRRRLEALDGEYKAGLAHCESRDLVTSHNSFGYLAARYNLEQVGITGLTPDEEPKPRDLAKVAAFVRRNNVRTIYYETLVSPAIARTVAAETGAQTAVLDPIEGLTESSQGKDYLQVMRANLANIRAGQPCR